MISWYFHKKSSFLCIKIHETCVLMLFPIVLRTLHSYFFSHRSTCSKQFGTYHYHMFLSQCRTFSRWHASKIEHFILSLFHSAPQNMLVTDTTHFFGQNKHVQNETSISANWSCTRLYVTYALTACFAYKLTCKTNWDVCSISIFYHHQWLEEYQYIKSENVEHFSKLAYLGLYFFNLHN